MPEPTGITAIITLTCMPPTHEHYTAIWHAATGHPNVVGSCLSSGGISPTEALTRLAEMIERDPLTFLRAQNIQVILPDTK